MAGGLTDGSLGRKMQSVSARTTLSGTSKVPSRCPLVYYLNGDPPPCSLEKHSGASRASEVPVHGMGTATRPEKSKPHGELPPSGTKIRQCANNASIRSERINATSTNRAIAPTSARTRPDNATGGRRSASARQAARPRPVRQLGEGRIDSLLSSSTGRCHARVNISIQ